jgi:hypothetical protein
MWDVRKLHAADELDAIKKFTHISDVDAGISL